MGSSKSKPITTAIAMNPQYTWFELVFYCFNNFQLFLNVNQMFLSQKKDYYAIKMEMDESKLSSDYDTLQQFTPLYKVDNVIQKNINNIGNKKQFIYLIYNDLLVPIPMITQNTDQNEVLSRFINQSRKEAERIYGQELSKKVEFYPPKDKHSTIIRVI
jgi:hypothetical protein